MPRQTPMVNSFNGGELSPRLDARIDLQRYYNGCLKLENMIPLAEGGAAVRPGFYFVAKVKDSSKRCKLWGFSFSTVQSYIIEVGPGYFRFYKDQGQIVVAYSAWLTGQNYVVGDLRTNGGNYYRCIVTHTSGVFATDLGAGKWALTTAADVAYEIVTGYLEADIFKIRTTQSADTMYMAHASYGPATLTRTGHTAWQTANFTATGGKIAVIQGASKANPCKITLAPESDMLLWANGQAVRIDSVIGMVELNGNSYTIANLDTVGKTFTIGVDSSGYSAYSSGGRAMINWTMFSGAGNYPAVVQFFEQRLWWFATNNNPQTAYGSKSADFVTYTTGTLAADGIEYRIATGKVDRIRWAAAKDDLLLGTVSKIYRLGGNGSADAITPTSINAKSQSGFGCADLDFEMVGESIMYVQKGGRKVRSIQYDLNSDGLVAVDITLGASHITKGSSMVLSGVVDWAYQQDPYSILWAVRADGVLLGVAYEPTEKILGWFRVVTDGLFESVRIMPSDSTEDEVWVIVKRTDGNGTVHRCIEYMKPHEFFSTIQDYFGVDSGLTYDGGAALDVTNVIFSNPLAIEVPGHTYSAGNHTRLSGLEVGGDLLTLTDDNVFTVDVDGDRLYLEGVNGLDIVPVGETPVPVSDYPAAFDIDHVNATTFLSANYAPWLACNPALTLTGTWDARVWVSDGGHTTNQRFHIDIGAARVLERVYYENAHTSGNETDCGVRAFTLWGSNSAASFADVTWASDTGWTQITTPVSEFDQHAAADAEDPKTFDLTGNTTAYRYYCFKFATNWGDATYIALRRLELQFLEVTVAETAGTAQKVAKVLSGFDHIEGKTVQVMAEGALHPETVVSSGSVTLDYYVNLAHVGLKRTGILKPMKIEPGSALGTSRGKPKRISKLVAAFYETFGAKWGPDEDHLQEIPFSAGGAPALRSEDVEYPFEADVTKEATVTVVQDLPFPMTVLALVPDVSGYGD